MIKKWMVGSIITLMMFTTACSGSKAGKEYKTKSLYDKGLELVQQADMLAESEDYIRLLSAGTELNETVKKIGEQDYSSPKEVYEISGMDDAFLKMIQEQTGNRLSKEVEDIVKDRFPSTVTSQLNSLSGVQFLAATSILTVEDTFLFQGLTQQKTYLYLYDDEYAGMVCFVPSEDDIVVASVSMIEKQQFADAASEEDIASAIEAIIGSDGITVTLVKK